MKPHLSHLDADGRPRMVDVTEKAVTPRRAWAEGRIVMARETLGHILAGPTPKGNVLSVAELAGAMGAKRTADLIPLCHQIPAVSIRMRLEADPALPGVVARAEASVTAQTGVEMEALTAVSVALLTVYDMTKAVDRSMRIEGIRLLGKEGGRSGSWAAEGTEVIATGRQEPPER